jgi:hypothetical protein
MLDGATARQCVVATIIVARRHREPGAPRVSGIGALFSR